MIVEAHVNGFFGRLERYVNDNWNAMLENGQRSIV